MQPGNDVIYPVGETPPVFRTYGKGLVVRAACQLLADFFNEVDRVIKEAMK